MSYPGCHEEGEDTPMEKEWLLIKEIPAKIDELDKLLVEIDFKDRILSQVHEDPVPWSAEGGHGSKGKDETQSVSSAVPCNTILSDLIDVIKPHIKQLLCDSNVLKEVINHMFLEEENDRPISTALMSLENTESKVKNYHSQVAQYFETRADLVAKVVKYPYLEDYRKAVQKLDEKQYVGIWLTLAEMRNTYSILRAIIYSFKKN